MARFYGMRLGLVVAALALTSSTFATAAPTAPREHYGGFELSSYNGSHIVAFVSASVYKRDDFAPVDVRYESQRAPFRFSLRDIDTRQACLHSAAVQPSSIAGWRSGRVKRLAG